MFVRILNIFHSHSNTCRLNLCLIFWFFRFIFPLFEMIAELWLASSTNVYWVDYLACFIVHIGLPASITLHFSHFYRHFYFISSVHHVHQDRNLVFPWCDGLRSKILILQLMWISLIIWNHRRRMTKSHKFLFFIYHRRFS